MEGLSRINININSGTAAQWPADSSSTYSQHSLHTFVTSPSAGPDTTGKGGGCGLACTTINISPPPPPVAEASASCPHHEAPSAATCLVRQLYCDTQGKPGVSDEGGQYGSHGESYNSAVTHYSGDGVPPQVPARVVRTVTTITDYANIYTHPRQVSAIQFRRAQMLRTRGEFGCRHCVSAPC